MNDVMLRLVLRLLVVLARVLVIENDRATRKDWDLARNAIREAEEALAE